MGLTIGSRLGHYDIRARLGAGGMGEVFRATDSSLGRDVAVKVLPPEFAADPERLARFKREARVLAALNHPNIVTVYSVETAGDVHYLTMELVNGTTLDRCTPARGLIIERFLRIAVQLADALAAAHAAGIVHRDLKPGNVLVTGDNRVKVVDFGLAREGAGGDSLGTTIANDALTREGQLLGTLPYMSPEQVEGRPADARSDIFSLGTVLYEMATGRRPFQGQTGAALTAAILRDTPASLDSVSAGITPEVARIVERCLRKDPGKRFQTAADLRVSLEDAGEALQGGGRATPTAPRSQWGRAMWAGIGIAALALFGAGVLLSPQIGRRAPALEPPVPLTSHPGLTLGPALSPDGRQVAFSWNGERQDNFDIYVQLVDGGTPLRLTDDPAPDLAPAWSPDGTKVAFLRTLDPAHGAIVVVPALGGPERQLAVGMFHSRASWTRDGGSLVVARRESVDAGMGLALLSVGTGEMKGLTEPPAEAWSGDVSPAVSPDGRTVAFARSLTRSNSEVFLLPLAADLTPAGEPRRLTAEGGNAAEPVWTTDGKRIVYSTGASGSMTTPRLKVLAVAAAGRQAQPLPFSDGGESPSVAGPGRLAYLRWLRDENVWRVGLAGASAEAPRRLADSTRRDVEPRVSPDGRFLTFCSDRSGSSQVWRCDADGSNPRQLTTMGGTMTAGARWSPDGQRIVFVSNQDGQMEIYLTTPEGRTPKRLTDDPSHDSAPSFSRDGRWVYFASNREDGFQVWKVAPQPGARPERVTRGGGYAALESADGRTLYYSKRDERTNWAVWRVPAAGGEETEVIGKIATWGDFDVTAGGLYYIDSAAAGAGLRFRRFADGSETVLARLAQRPSFGIAASGDDRSVFFSQYDQESTEIWLVEGFQ